MKKPSDVNQSDTDAVFLDAVANDDGTDPLSDFESEAELGQPGDQTTQPSSGVPTSAGSVEARGPIALDQVLLRMGHVSWTEAVSIIDALCAVLTESGSRRVPAISHVAITSSGTVVASGFGPSGAAGALLARMLHSLTAAGAMPAPLRLFITKWVSASEKHPMSEFAKELAYFARPDGQALIQALYERALATAVAAQPRPTPRSATRSPRAVRGLQAPSARQLYGAVAVIVLSTVLAAAYAIWMAAPPPPSNPAMFSSFSNSPIASETLTTFDDSVIGGSAPRTAPEGGSSTPRAATGSTGATPRPVGVPTAPTPVSPAVRASIPGPTTPSPAPVAGEAAREVPGDATRELARADRSRTLEELLEARRAGLPSPAIYSGADPDVTPPAFMHPQLPAQFLNSLRPDMNTIELIVSEAGTVERVRLVSTPKRMADMMLLSGAKNWEFEPAMKDGQPVRYRLEVSWAATP